MKPWLRFFEAGTGLVYITPPCQPTQKQKTKKLSTNNPLSNATNNELIFTTTTSHCYPSQFAQRLTPAPPQQPH